MTDLECLHIAAPSTEMPFDPVRLQKTLLDTSPDKLAAMPLDTLQACHLFLTDQQPELYYPKDLPIVAQRIEQLGREIELRRMEARSDQQHGQVIGLGRKTLRWAKVGGIAGLIAAIAGVIGTIVLLLYDTPLSKPLPSTVLRASPTPSPPLTPSLAPSQTPTEAESPSATPTASLESSPASTPELLD